MNLKWATERGLRKTLGGPCRTSKFWPGASWCLGDPVNLLDDQTILTNRDTLNAELDLT